jgi:hypothetical protein
VQACREVFVIAWSGVRLVGVAHNVSRDRFDTCGREGQQLIAVGLIQLKCILLLHD